MITTPETYFEASLFKRCTKCGVEKALQEFHKRPSAKDGLRTDCRACKAEAKRRWQQTPEGRSKMADAQRRWMKNPENRTKRAEAKRRWRLTPYGRAKQAESQRRRLQTDPQYRLAHLLRKRLWTALKGIRKSARTLELLGCPIKHLAKHLESKFLPGMSWQNHGEWHVDHIRPLASFDLTDSAQQRQACHWTNLQPLWASDNLRKGDKL